MAVNSLTNGLTRKHLWYLTTICSFVVGAAIGWLYAQVPSYSKLLHYIFWIYPYGIAGLTMGFTQWSIIRRMHKYSYLWIPAMTIGTLASIGAALTLVVAVPAYFEGSLFDKIDGMLVIFTQIAPIALLIGPICQWLIARQFVDDLPFKEFLKICVGWIVAAFLPFVMSYPINFVDQRIGLSFLMSFFLYAIVLNVPSGLVFAYITKSVIRPSENNVSTPLHI